MNRRAKLAAKVLFQWAGGTSRIRNRFRGSVRILMYHRFPPESRLEAQCVHLRKYYEPISLTEAAERLGQGTPISGHPVVITVDDGYRDFLENAFPVLSRHGIPATVFLTTDLPDLQSWLWVDRVTYCFKHTPLRECDLEIGERKHWLLDGDGPRREAAQSTKEAMKALPNAERLRWLDELPRLLEVAVPATPPPSHAPLTWEDVRVLAGRGVEFGAHTRTHPILSRLPLSDLEAEIVGSKERIER